MHSQSPAPHPLPLPLQIRNPVKLDGQPKQPSSVPPPTRKREKQERGKNGPASPTHPQTETRPAPKATISEQPLPPPTQQRDSQGGQKTPPEFLRAVQLYQRDDSPLYDNASQNGAQTYQPPQPGTGDMWDALPTPDALFTRPESDPRHWLKRQVNFDVRQYPLPKLLREFAAIQGVSCQVSDRLASGTVSGMSQVHDPSEFLDTLCRAQHMNWYYDGGTVYFFADTDMQSRMFTLQPGEEMALRTTMHELGIYDSRFAWRVADNGHILLIQGPPQYLAHIDQLLSHQLNSAQQAAQEKKLGVFRLKHAWATTRTIASGDGNVTIPGVAELLQQIVSGNADGGGFSTVMPTSPGTPRMKKGTGVVARQNASADNPPPGPGGAQEGGGDIPFIQADPRLNAVLVWDYERNHQRLRSIVETLDQPLALVEIRAAIIDVEASRAKDLGVSWEFLNEGGRWHNNAGSNVGDGLGREGGLDRITGDGFQYSTIFTKGLDQFMLRVSALEKDGCANILSRPSVLTQDNTQATLEHTETFYVRLTGEREVDLADITTGLTLRVTPHVIEGDYGENAVQLAVYIVNGGDIDNDDSLIDDLPRVRQSTISTQAVVLEGEALIIGGYYNEVRTTNTTGVPGLQRLPGLGALFRTKGSSTTKSERLFVLSPRIVYSGETPFVTGSEGERMFEESPAKKLFNEESVETKKKPEKRERGRRRNQRR